MFKRVAIAILALACSNSGVMANDDLPLYSFNIEQPTINEETSNTISDEDIIIDPATYIEMDVPNIESSFKTYMDYRTITDRTSKQYEFMNNCWVDDDGFVRYSDGYHTYYSVAMGSYYGVEIGTKFEIVTDNGNIFYAILGDCKSDLHTDDYNQYSFNNDVIECIVDTRVLDRIIRLMGNCDYHSPLSGNIVSITKIIF